MNERAGIDDTVDRLYAELNREAEAAGYHLNPDIEFTKSLVKGLITNEIRYGYRACPCRLATGNKDDDLDIICPCDYRDPDLDDYSACYCALYVSKAVQTGKQILEGSIPERRPPLAERMTKKAVQSGIPARLPLPVWRCKVCGYLCARPQPPEICPICKAKKDRFEQFM